MHPIFLHVKNNTMENLNKENFWDELFEAFPKGVQVFCDWIDKYKGENNWNVLFNSDSNWQDADGKNAPAPKFHDIPIAMQIGIWIEFSSQFPTAHEWEIGDLSTHNWRQEITQFCKLLHEDEALNQKFRYILFEN